MNKPTFILCPPDYFDVSYVINPWMHPDEWAENRDAYTAAARTGWGSLVDALNAAGAEVHVMPAGRDVPDLVFTANVASVLDGKALLARFRHPERRKEEPLIAAFFTGLQDQGLIKEVRTCPPELTFEGAGDAVWDETRQMLWMGHGPRTSLGMKDVLAEYYGVPVTPLRLVDERFYHLDTAFCPLSGGDVIYFPAAFDDAGQAAIRARIPADKLIAIDEDDATRLAANAVCIGRRVIAGNMTDGLKAEIESRGYDVVLTDIGAFAKSGGSAYCLTLRLDRRTRPASGARRHDIEMAEN